MSNEDLSTSCDWGSSRLARITDYLGTTVEKEVEW
jgi:hypothetical protein